MSSDTQNQNLQELHALEMTKWKKDKEHRQAFFSRVRSMTDVEFVNAVRDCHECREDWMSYASVTQDLDREFRCRELLAKQSTGGRA